MRFDVVLLVALTLLSFCLGKVCCQDLKGSVLFTVLTSETESPVSGQAKSPENALRMILDLADDGKLSSASAGPVLQIGKDVLFEIASGYVRDEISKALTDANTSVGTLDPSNDSDLKRLTELAEVVNELRLAVHRVESDLSKNVNTLLTASMIAEGTSASHFALFWYRDLPKLRKDLNSLAAKIKSKTKPAAGSNAANEEQPDSQTGRDFGAMKSDEVRLTETVRWAHQKAEEFQKYRDSNDQSHRREAEILLQWCEKVQEALPAEADRDDYDVAIYGSHQVLRNTVSVYLGK